ncbi:hypothetical protein A11S_1546 [Micavibrio aeruginosavorus EPB]|uniref:Cyclodipeptide synthase n=2 Tax=Micavibrio aeruginosavorus TaxID=349221 RepID=M4VG43_9BACT|nr:hypothetical protein A11S_1546 [Micavibrio aeruginosavorus EPB]
MKVAPKSLSIWKEYKTACVGISMHSENHVGEALHGMLNWVQENFENCILDFSDLLYRHNYISAGYSPEVAFKLSQEDGSKWLRNNMDIIQSISIPTKIIHWQTWLNHPDFIPNLNQFRHAYNTQPAFRDALLGDVSKFYKRKNSEPSSGIESIENSVEYMLEELAAHSILYTEHPSAVIYPGKQHESFKMVRAGQVASVPQGIKNSKYVRMIVYNFDSKCTHTPDVRGAETCLISQAA